MKFLMMSFLFFLSTLQFTFADCLTPTDLNSSRTDKVLTLTWNGTAEQYNIYYAYIPSNGDEQEGFLLMEPTLFKTANATSTQIQIKDLTGVHDHSSTTHRFSIEGVCDGGAERSTNMGTIDVVIKGNVGNEKELGLLAPTTGNNGNGSNPTRFKVPTNKLQATFSQESSKNKRLVYIDMDTQSSGSRFDVEFAPNPSNVKWNVAYNLSPTQLKAKIAEMKQKGFLVVQLNVYLYKGLPHYSAIFEQRGNIQLQYYFGLSVAAHRAKMETLSKQGYYMVSISAVKHQGKTQVAAVYHKSSKK